MNKRKKDVYFVILNIIFIIISLVYLIYFERFGKFEAYFLYLCMTFSLVMVVKKIYMYIYKKVNNYINNNIYLKEYRNDYRLKYKISLYGNLIVNIIYGIFKLISGIVFNSLWFIVFSVYYILLVILRVNILREELNNNSSIEMEYVKYRKTAYILLFMNVILIFIILIIIDQNIVSIYPDWIAITIALYTFIIIFNSIYNFIKYYKYNSPLMVSAKIINVITSLISLISLEIVLISTFGNNNMFFLELMVILTGGSIAFLITSISIYMIIRSNKFINSNIYKKD